IEGTKQVMQLDRAPDLPDFKRPNPNRAPRRPATPPTDWNDAPEPRRRKPKPEERKPAKPPAQKPKDPAVHAPLDPSKRVTGKPAGTGKDAPRKPRHAGPKGSPPPKGKPSSKKNRARAAAQKAAKGGTAPPKRR
ncbi:MAG: hypothetical protein AAFO86_06070, partial [Pseudomonadota bacterium]